MAAESGLLTCNFGRLRAPGVMANDLPAEQPPIVTQWPAEPKCPHDAALGRKEQEVKGDANWRPFRGSKKRLGGFFALSKAKRWECAKQSWRGFANRSYHRSREKIARQRTEPTAILGRLCWLPSSLSESLPRPYGPRNDPCGEGAILRRLSLRPREEIGQAQSGRSS